MPVRAKRVLVPVVLSLNGERTLRAAAEVARSGGGRMLLFHVFDVRALEDVYNLHGLGENEVRGRMQENASRVIARLMARKWMKGLRAEVRYGTGIPEAEIVREARDWRADLVVLGRRPRGGIAHLLYGQTAEGVVRDAPCSVLVIAL